MIDIKRFDEICNENKLRGNDGEVEVYLLYRDNKVVYVGIARVMGFYWARSRWMSHNNPNHKYYKEFDYFKVVEVTTPELAIQRENYHIKKYYDNCWVSNGGFNRTWSCGAISEETRKKKSNIMRGKNVGKNSCWSGVTGDKHPRGKYTQEEKDDWDNMYTVKWMTTLEIGYLLGIDPGVIGKELKKRGVIRKSSRAKPVIATHIITGKEILFKTSLKAAKFIGVKSNEIIIDRCNGKKNNAYKYYYWNWYTYKEVQEMAVTRDNQE